MRIVLAAIVCLVGFASARADVFTNVTEAADYQVAYELPIPVNGAFRGATHVPYSVDNSATAAPAGFDRVAYYLELTNGSAVSWVYASMDAFTNVVTQTGLPHDTDNNIAFQKKVTDLHVLSNVTTLTTGAFDFGQIEIWHNDYTAADPLAIFGASSGTFDWGDTIGSGVSAYGSFQVSAPSARQMVFAYNRWSSADSANDDIGIGNAPSGNPDWTFAATTTNYTSRKLVVLVRPKRFAVTFTSAPRNQAIVPRNVSTNLAAVTFAGQETAGGFDKATLRTFRNGVAYGTPVEQPLAYSAGAAPFNFTSPIPGELASYSFELSLQKGSVSYLAKKVTGVAAGDVYLWYGQSNAQASAMSGTASGYETPWVRTFGESSDSASVTQAYSFWAQAVGDGSLNWQGGVGQWAMVVGRRIVDTYGIPVAIFNGAHGGYNMAQLQRDDANLNALDDSGTTFRVYNRLRYRVRQAGVAGAVRAIFFYQGEQEGDATAQYVAGFNGLMQDWQEDYPAVERVYETQVHVGCGVTRELPVLRDAQRRFADVYPTVRLMSTNGLTVFGDLCHYPFPGGYETHGLNHFRIVARDLYGAPDSPDIDPPNPLRAELANLSGDRLRIVLRKPGAALTIQTPAETDFRLNGSNAVLTAATIASGGTAIELQYDRVISGATSVDYLGHIGNDPGWIRNANGVGLLTFTEPIISQAPVVTAVSPAAFLRAEPGAALSLASVATTPTGVITRMEIYVDGVLHDAINGASAVNGGWVVPASGTHKVTFRAYNTDGYYSDAAVIVLAESAGAVPAAPGGVANGLSVWLRPESGIAKDAGGLVSQWSDSSGNGNHATQVSDSVKPLYSAKAFGYLPGLSFSNAFLACATGMPAAPAATSYTKVLRASFADFTVSDNLLSTANSGGGTAHALFMGASPNLSLYHDTVFAKSSASLALGQSYVIMATYDGVSQTGKLYLDGNLLSLSASSTAPPNMHPDWEIGGYLNNYFLHGAIGEVMIYNRVLADAEIAGLVNYFNAKAQLPADAPRLTYAAWSSGRFAAGQDASPTGDPNGNRLSNLMEYALGLDPVATSFATVLETRDDAPQVTVKYRHPTDRAGIAYQLLESLDLRAWTPVTDSAGVTINGVEERNYSRSLLPGRRAFYRLQVSQSP